MKVIDYKPHIDGLRALAILPVIFFHADFKLFNGGYVGVDIFFVISGYLITNIIIRDLSKKKFNLKNFYLRRARRILPALLFVTTVSLLISLVLMSNEQLKFFSKQIISVILFYSNFFFWRNTGYFDPNSELQPLLHTWSLGVEEQFYIFFPIFLIFIWNYFSKKVVIIFIILSFLSLLLSQIGGNFKIQNFSSEIPFLVLPFEFFWQAGSANFFLPFGRIWELLAGSLISILIRKKKISDKKLNNYFTFLGVILILISIFTFSENIQYPSIYTILPVAGTSLLIVFSTYSTFTYKILSFKPLVFFGLISFSLYLWHQPLLAFNRIYYGIDLGFYHKVIIIFITFIFSILTWKFIEQPFKDKKKINNHKFIIILFSSSFMLLLLSILILSSKINSIQKPLPKNISNTMTKENPKNCFDLDYAHLQNKKWYCEIGANSEEISFAIIGDSHALALKPAFDKAGITKNKKGIFTGFSGCPSLLGINSLRADLQIKNCKLLNEKMFNFVKNNKIEKIFLVSRWSYYTVGNHSKTNFNLIFKDGYSFSNKIISKNSVIFGIENTLKRYKDLNTKVVFIHQVPEQVYHPEYAYQKSLDKNNEIDMKKLSSFAVDYTKHTQQQKFIIKNLNKINNEFTNLKEIDFDNIFCNNLKCSLGGNDSSYYADKNHLSINGALLVLEKIKSLIN